MKRVLTGITGQFSECELEQLMRRPLDPEPRRITQLFQELKALDRLYPLIQEQNVGVSCKWGARSVVTLAILSA